MTAWLGYWLGLTDPSGGPYLFWSGLGADLTEFAIIGGLINLARKHNCHVHGCIRVGRHPVEGTTHVVCRRHHPDGPLRAHELTAQAR